jgi:hypothetical protein
LSGLGAVTVLGERVRAIDALQAAHNQLSPSSTTTATEITAKRHYRSIDQQPLQLDVATRLYAQLGLWYGAEFATPHGSAMLVGVDAQGRAWFAHDDALLAAGRASLASYGALSLAELQAIGVQLREDRRLLGKPSRPTATTASISADTVANARRLQQLTEQVSAQRGAMSLLETQLQRLAGERDAALASAHTNNNHNNNNNDADLTEADDEAFLDQDNEQQHATHVFHAMINERGELVPLDNADQAPQQLGFDAATMRALNQALAEAAANNNDNNNNGGGGAPLDADALMANVQRALSSAGLDVTLLDGGVQFIPLNDDSQQPQQQQQQQQQQQHDDVQASHQRKQPQQPSQQQPSHRRANRRQNARLEAQQE